MKTFALLALAGSAAAFAPVAQQVSETEYFFRVDKLHSTFSSIFVLRE